MINESFTEVISIPFTEHGRTNCTTRMAGCCVTTRTCVTVLMRSVLAVTFHVLAVAPRNVAEIVAVIAAGCTTTLRLKGPTRYCPGTLM